MCNVSDLKYEPLCLSLLKIRGTVEYIYYRLYTDVNKENDARACFGSDNDSK